MNTTRPRFTPPGSFVVMAILAALALVGCQPASNPAVIPASPGEPVSTPTPSSCNPITAGNDIGLTLLTLADNSQIELGENTEIIFTPAGYCPGLAEHHILIKQGQVAISSQLQQGKMMQINSPAGYLAQVNRTGLITYNPADGSFRIDCTSSPCSMGVSASSMIALNCGESGKLDAAGVYSGPTAINLEELLKFGEWLLPQCPITPAPSSTPDFGATATAACASFEDQFPLTPCPPSNP